MRLRLLTTILCAVPLAVAGEYKTLKQFPVPGDGSWDYLLVDAPSHRLYVSHFSQTQVLNTDTGEVVGSIPGKGVHGIALVPQARRGYITNGTADNVTVF